MICKNCKNEYKIGCLCGLCYVCIKTYGHEYLHKALNSYITKKKIINLNK